MNLTKKQKKQVNQIMRDHYYIFKNDKTVLRLYL